MIGKMSKSFPTQINENETNPKKNDPVKEKTTIEKIEDNQTNEKKNFKKIKNNMLENLKRSNKEQNFNYIPNENLGTSPEQFLEKCNNASKEPKGKNTSIQKNQLLKNLIEKNEQKIQELCKKVIRNKEKQYLGYNNSQKQSLNKDQCPKGEKCLLFTLYKKSLLEGKTENNIKNIFFSQLRKKALQKNKGSQNPKSKKPYKDLLQFLSIVSKEDKNKLFKLQKTNEIQFTYSIKIKEQKLNSNLSKEMANKNKKIFNFLQKKTKRDNINEEKIETESKFAKNGKKNKNVNKFSNKLLSIDNTISFQVLVTTDETNVEQTPMINLYVNNLFNFNSYINEYHISDNSNLNNNSFVNGSCQTYEPICNIMYNNYCAHINNKLEIPKNDFNTYSQFNYNEGYNKEDLYIVNEILREVQTEYFDLTNIVIGLDKLLIVLNEIENNS